MYKMKESLKQCTFGCFSLFLITGNRATKHIFEYERNTTNIKEAERRGRLTEMKEIHYHCDLQQESTLKMRRKMSLKSQR